MLCCNLLFFTLLRRHFKSLHVGVHVFIFQIRSIALYGCTMLYNIAKAANRNKPDPLSVSFLNLKDREKWLLLPTAIPVVLQDKLEGGQT